MGVGQMRSFGLWSSRSVRFLADALGLACILDGTVSEDIAKRMGYTHFPDCYNWPCTEFRSEETGSPHAEWMALIGQKPLPLEAPDA